MADSCAKLCARETWNVIQDAAAGSFRSWMQGAPTANRTSFAFLEIGPRSNNGFVGIAARLHRLRPTAIAEASGQRGAREIAILPDTGCEICKRRVPRDAPFLFKIPNLSGGGRGALTSAGKRRRHGRRNKACPIAKASRRTRNPRSPGRRSAICRCARSAPSG
jgi:hypothetical protein